MKRLILLSSMFTVIASSFSQKQEVEQKIQSIIKDKKATIGVAILYDNKERVVINNDHHYAMLSTFKFHQALATLDYLNKANQPISKEIFIRPSDLIANTYSPMRRESPEGNYNRSITELLKYSVSMSDNNACDILFKYVLSPGKVNRYIKNLGITEGNISTNEQLSNKKFENQYLNWTTPLAAAQLIELFLQKNLFPPNLQEFMERTLIETSTGMDKIRGGVPNGAIVGHKTGSSSRNKHGMKGADNDIGFVRLPNGHQFIIAVYVMNSMESDITNASIIAQIAQAACNYYNKK